MADAVHKGGIDAMLLAEGDLALGLDFVKGLATKDELPYLASNLDCGDGFPAKDKVLSKDGVTVGVLGVVNNELVYPGCTATDPQAAVRDGLERLKGKVDVVVLLDALTEDVSAGLMKAVPGVDLVVGGTSQPLQSPLPVPGGGLQLGPGGRGRSVGVLTWTLSPNATSWHEDSTIGRLASQRDVFRQKVSEANAAVKAAASDTDRAVAQKRADYYQKQVDDVDAQLAIATTGGLTTNTAHNTLVTLDTAVKDDPTVVQMVADAKTRIAAAAPVSVSAPAVALTSPHGSPYVGNGACSACHAGPSAQWSSTAHAHAYASLEVKNRQLDQDCYTCHVTGAVAVNGAVTGPTKPTEVSGLTNVGCESCHGPGREHVESPTTPMAIPQQATCEGCHTAAQTEGRFDFATYLPQIVHNGSITADAPGEKARGGTTP